VLGFAQAEGHIEEDRVNPPIWTRFKDSLPNPDILAKQLGHRRNHAAMPYADLPAFMAKLEGATGLAVNALMLAILTAARSVEVIGMQWDAVDFDAKRWTVPAERMKMGAEHAVPLSDAAVELLRGKEAKRRPKHPHVFPGARPGKLLSSVALAMTTRHRVRGVRATRAVLGIGCKLTDLLATLADCPTARSVSSRPVQDGVRGALRSDAHRRARSLRVGIAGTASRTGALGLRRRGESDHPSGQ
jgi:integrase